MEEILPPQQHRIMEQAKFTCSQPGTALEKQRETVEEQDEKHVEALQSLDIEYLPNVNISATNEID